MGTHPIFESDFDCLTVKSNVRLPKERSQQECNAGPEFKVDIERVEVRGCFVGSGSQCRRSNQERLGPSRYLHDAVHYSVSDKAKLFSLSSQFFWHLPSLPIFSLERSMTSSSPRKNSPKKWTTDSPVSARASSPKSPK